LINLIDVSKAQEAHLNPILDLPFAGVVITPFATKNEVAATFIAPYPSTRSNLARIKRPQRIVKGR